MVEWRGSTAYIEPLSKLLKSIQINRSLAHVTLTPTGLKICSSSPSRTHNSQLFLESSLFATFEFDQGSSGGTESERETDLTLTLSLTALVHCLQMFMEWSSIEGHTSSFTGCFFSYAPGQKFQVSFAHDTMNSVCDLTVYEANGNDANDDITFMVDDVVLQVILAAPVFAGVLRDLDAVAAKEISLLVNVDPPQLEVRGIGELASTEFVLPNEPSVLDALAADTNAAFSYDFTNFVKCREAVRLAKRVSLRFDSSGVLSVQCLTEIEDHSCYIEFRFLSLFIRHD